MVVLKYHSPPSYSINPSDAGGVLQLGSIIKHIDSADEPLNEDCHVTIPASKKIQRSQHRGFTARLSGIRKGDFGIWAKLFGVDSVGGELNWAPERSGEDVYHFREVDTEYFNPSREYMQESMEQDDVDIFVTESKGAPVYMVTGLKTARGPSVWMAAGKSDEVKFELGLHQPGGIPVGLGPRLNASREVRREMGFEDSDDFIVGIRVKKLVYKRHWLKRTRGALTATEHNEGAVLADDRDDEEKEDDEILDLGDESDGEVEVEKVEDVDGERIEEVWVTGKN